MKIYYHNRRTKKSVSPDSPVDMSVQQTIRILNTPGIEFLGIEIAEPFIFQLCYEEGAFKIEILNTNQPSATGCLVTMPMAEEAVRMVFSGKNVKTELSNMYPWIKWEKEDISNGPADPIAE